MTLASCASPSRRPGGFSLIELLVVIAILAILASLLLPTIRMVQSQARALVCRSNMNQIYLGITSYTADFRGQLPYGLNYDGGGGINANAWGETWGTTIAVQLEVRVGTYGQGNPPYDQQEPVTERSRLGVFNCPENRTQTWQMATGGGESCTSYTGNCWGDLTQPWNAPWGSRYFTGRTSRLGHSGELMAFWDGCYYRSEAWQDDGSGTIPYRGIGSRNVRYAHNGRANVMYADGHSETTSLMRSMGSSTAVPVSIPMRAASWTNGKPWWGAD